jgi:hypothetical protein
MAASWRVVWLSVALIGAGLLVSTAAAQEGRDPAPVQGCVVKASSQNVNVRSGPAARYGVIGTLLPGQTLPITGVLGEWYAVIAQNASGETVPQAWIAAGAVTLEGACEALPAAPDPGPPADMRRLEEVPILPESLDGSLRDIFARGQALGGDSRAFTKIGDCNTDTSHFLAGFDRDQYDLGPYADLQPTLDYFAGWFEHVSLAGQVGFNALTVLDPLWADPNICPNGEGPLACEYRRHRPSVVVMMFGPNDMINLTEPQFAEAVRGIIELSLDEGVIPVLTTFTWHEDRQWETALRYNVILVDLADEYDLPLINFWRAAQALPNHGLMDDYTHLTDSGLPGGDFTITFAHGEETFSGYALRNLLTLQMLDRLRREVLAAESKGDQR